MTVELPIQRVHAETELPQSRRSPSPRVIAAALLALGLALLASDPYFNFIEDEVSIVTSAAAPATTTVNLFLQGTGQHEHPPLYDLLLHGWMQLAGAHLWLLRVPSIVFYLAGIWVLIEIARRFSGARAANAALWIGVAWPFGFHYGRLATWYSLSFLLVAVLTLTYLEFQRTRTVANWMAFTAAGVLLLYTSYFGWAILGCILLDYIWRTRYDLLHFRAPGSAIVWPNLGPRRAWWPVWSTLLVLSIAFLPLARAFTAELHRGVSVKDSLLGSALFEAFNVYSVFVSESVAPWYGWLAAPACVAIVVCTVAILIAGPPLARRLYLGFLALVTVMCAGGVIGTKRLLLISPWAVLAVAICAGAVPTRRWRLAVAASLAVIAAVGWFGIVARQYYAAPRFLEPWHDVAVRMAHVVRRGGTVIADHQSLFFYLTFALNPRTRLASLDGEALWSSPQYPQQVYTPAAWLSNAGRADGEVFLVKTVTAGPATEEAEHELRQRCALTSTDLLLPDSGFKLKQRFLPRFPRVRYRIEVQHYLCRNASAH